MWVILGTSPSSEIPFLQYSSPESDNRIQLPHPQGVDSHRALGDSLSRNDIPAELK